MNDEDTLRRFLRSFFSTGSGPAKPLGPQLDWDTVHSWPESAHAEREHLTESERMPQEEGGVLLQEKRASRHETSLNKHIWLAGEIALACYSMFFFLDATACHTLICFASWWHILAYALDISWHILTYFDIFPAAQRCAEQRLRLWNCCCRKKTTEELAEAQEEDQAPAGSRFPSRMVRTMKFGHEWKITETK